MNNIRDAILRTAALFETRPAAFDYYATQVPPDCGTPGCVIGHIALAAGLPTGTNVHDAALCGTLFGAGPLEVYERLYGLGGYWQGSADVAARALRAYADKYHPAEVSKVIVPEAGSWDLIPWQPKKVRA